MEILGSILAAAIVNFFGILAGRCGSQKAEGREIRIWKVQGLTVGCDFLSFL